MAGQTAFVPVAAVTPNLAGAFELALDEGVVISHRMWQGSGLWLGQSRNQIVRHIVGASVAA